MSRVDRDPRWSQWSAGDDVIDGRPIRSIRDLRGHSRKCLELLPIGELPGSASVLRVARSLFVHSWFDVDFLSVTCMASQQAFEAALHELYPETPSFKRLVNRAEKAGVFTKEIAEVARSGIDIRDLLSHPLDVASCYPSFASSMLMVSHRLVLACWATFPLA